MDRNGRNLIFWTVVSWGTVQDKVTRALVGDWLLYSEREVSCFHLLGKKEHWSPLPTELQAGDFSAF